MPEFVECDNYCDRSNLSRDEMFAFPYRLVGLILLQSPSLRLLVILGRVATNQPRFACLDCLVVLNQSNHASVHYISNQSI
jgi:hypothetical protein